MSEMPYPSLRRLAGTQEVQETHISLDAVSDQPQMKFLKNIWLFGFHLMWWKRCQRWPPGPQKEEIEELNMLCTCVTVSDVTRNLH